MAGRQPDPPQFPDLRKSTKPFQEFRMAECRDCRERSEWTVVEVGAFPDWEYDHIAATGHRRFWVYDAQRASSHYRK